jgi:hypothetical protein
MFGTVTVDDLQTLVTKNIHSVDVELSVWPGGGGGGGEKNGHQILKN